MKDKNSYFRSVFEEEPEMVALPEIGSPHFCSDSQHVAKVNSSTGERRLDVMLLVFKLDQTAGRDQGLWQVNVGVRLGIQSAQCLEIESMLVIYHV